MLNDETQALRIKKWCTQKDVNIYELKVDLWTDIFTNTFIHSSKKLPSTPKSEGSNIDSRASQRPGTDLFKAHL